MEFIASFDAFAALFTAGFFITLVILLFWQWRSRKRTPHNPFYWIRSALFLICFATATYCFLIHPREYVVNQDKLVIKRIWNNIQIPTKQILDCSRVSDADMDGATRTFGIGGLFGYSGIYHNRTVGKMKFYATRYSNFVLIHTLKGEAIIITPDKPKEVIDEITSDITINN